MQRNLTPGGKQAAIQLSQEVYNGSMAKVAIPAADHKADETMFSDDSDEEAFLCFEKKVEDLLKQKA
jgi:hypothetical protein